jgi:hypothetical protein
MTVFANPAGTAAGNTTAYREAVLAILGERDPVVVLSELPEWLARRTRGLDDTRARRPELPGKWSVVEVVAHLTDAELVHSYRTRMTVAEQEPPLPGYDQDGWALEFHYATADLTATLAFLTHLREWNLAYWRTLTPAQLSRVGHHSERGPESAGTYLRLAAGHDLVHRRQIDRILG